MNYYFEIKTSTQILRCSNCGDYIGLNHSYARVLEKELVGTTPHYLVFKFTEFNGTQMVTDTEGQERVISIKHLHPKCLELAIEALGETTNIYEVRNVTRQQTLSRRTSV